MELKNITGEFLLVALIENYIPKAGFFLSDFCFTVRPLSSRCVCVTHGNSDVYCIAVLMMFNKQ